MGQTRDELARLDAGDPLARFREGFELPEGVIYLDGNSLGALPKGTPERLSRVMTEEWGQGLIRSWNTAGWIEAPQRVGTKIARLIGAQADEVIVADSTSVNLFKLLAGAVSLSPGRTTILSEPGNFPTDLYVAHGLERLLEGRVRLKTVPAAELPAAIDEDVAAVLLTHVHYRSGLRWPMGEITEAANAKGALALWDLSHSVGALEIDLNGCGADLAVGCGYKYLNGGPGAPAFLYVARRHQRTVRQPLSGWMGHAEPFAFDDAYRPAGDIRTFLCGTPPILGLAALEQGVDLALEAGMAEVEAKGRRLGDLFIRLVEDACGDLMLVSPREAGARGLHVSFAHPDGYAIVQALIARGVVGDFRAPDVLRFGFAPLYLRYTDVWDAAEILAELMRDRGYDRPEHRVRAAVT